MNFAGAGAIYLLQYAYQSIEIPNRMIYKNMFIFMACGHALER